MLLPPIGMQILNLYSNYKIEFKLIISILVHDLQSVKDFVNKRVKLM